MLCLGSCPSPCLGPWPLVGSIDLGVKFVFGRTARIRTACESEECWYCTTQHPSKVSKLDPQMLKNFSRHSRITSFHEWPCASQAMNPALKRQFEAATAVDKVVEKQKQTRGREIGTVLDYDKAKGFGFLLDADSEKIFVHQSQIVSPGFRMLMKDQKVSFLRGENRGKPWAEDVRNPDGTQISQEKPEESSSTMAKKRRQQLKEQWRNFFEIPQYAVKGYGESLPATVANQDAFALGETVPQLGKVFVMAHGCASSSGKGNEAASYAKEKLPKFIAKAYEEHDFPS